MCFKPGQLVRLSAFGHLSEAKSYGKGSGYRGSRIAVDPEDFPMIYLGEYSDPEYCSDTSRSLEWNAQILFNGQFMIARSIDLVKFETGE